MDNSLDTKAIESLVRAAASFQLKHFRKVEYEAVDMKAAKETVSFVDVQTEEILFEGLQKIVPEAGFFGEESGKTGNQDLVWVVDPLDGTTNFLSGCDHFSISVCLLVDNKPQYGLVHRPYTGESIVAIRDAGVKLNSREMKPRCLQMSASDSLFVTGFPYRSKDLNEPFFKVLGLGRGIRRTGSAALDLAHLGCGFYQGFWESDLQPYDVAAALLMLEENGITATNHLGEVYDMNTDRVLIAGFPSAHQELIKVIADEYNDFL